MGYALYPELLADETATGQSAAVLPPSPVELNLLFEWPNERSQWAKVLSASLAVHAMLFAFAVQLPSFIKPSEPEPAVITKRTRLYLPPDVLTQKAPNRHKLSKQIDLDDLLASRTAAQRKSMAGPSRRHFQAPKVKQPKLLAKNTPQILPQAPSVSANATPAPLPPGSQTGLVAPVRQPARVNNPFQDVGSEQPQKPGKIAAPKASVQAAIGQLAQDANSRKLVITDDNHDRSITGSSGSLSHLPAQHAAVELQSDPQGADFRPYLAQILAIVRANWRRVIPESVRMGTLRGRTVVEFTVNRDGSIPHLDTADPSGSEPLDRAAIAGLSMSNPLPPLPADYKGFQVRLAFTFSYNMPQ